MRRLAKPGGEIMTIVPVILCGGSGTRLWPASRESYPKQFLSFGSGPSLFQATVLRVSGRDEGGPDFGRPIIVTGSDYRFLVAEQLRQIGCEADIVLEPFRRDSAAAIAAGAVLARRRAADAVVLVLPADHFIPEPASFREHVGRGLPVVRDDRILTFGITPDGPATGYGYIKPGAPLDGDPSVRAIGSFVEKPDRETAKRYLTEGYLWNSGNFLFSAEAFLSELAALAPDIAEPVADSVDKAVRDLDFLRLDPDAFARARSQSIDYALMEKTARSAILLSSFAWSDIGSWAAIHDFMPKDADNNVAIGEAVFQNSRNSIAHSESGLVAVVGLDNVVVVNTRDAVLVAPRDATADVKALVERLKAQNRKEATEHTKVFRPWGSYESLDNGTRHQVKRIRVLPGGKLSLQSHVHRAEHWVVVNGTARVTVNDKVVLLTENESIYIPLGAHHRMENPGKVPLDIIEVQSGSYLGEDDIIRYEDVYNRG